MSDEDTASGVFNYEVVREGDDVILRIDLSNYLGIPTLEDNPVVMAKTIDVLISVKDATKIVFYQRRDYEYDEDQTAMLNEIARLYNSLTKQKDFFSYQALSFGGKCSRFAAQWYAEMQTVMFKGLKEDPIGSYVELKRFIRRERIKADNTGLEDDNYCFEKYISTLTYLVKILEKTKLMRIASNYIEGMHIGDRKAYAEIFHPVIKPDFMYTKLLSTYPPFGEEIDNYIVGDDTEVTIFKFPDTVQYLYHISPPEFKLTEDKYDILDIARRIMAEHKPTRSEFINPKRMRDVFFNVGYDLIEELTNYKNLRMNSKDIEELTRVLVRYTVGFGLVEVLLQDDKIQDVSINSPAGRIPIFVVHADYDDCKTNIYPTRTETESWASKLRLISGRPLDEANPILDTELILPGASSRISVIAPPLDPSGIAFSFRRHRDKPWTLPLFMKYKAINPLAAGLLNFMVDGTRSMLIAGTRSSGKSSFLSALMIEIMRRYRIITIEDTLELPTNSMKDLGFNIQPMKVASSLVKGSSEMSASDGIRSTLRLGDSALIVGEVRSTEAKALYEAMRVGGAANVVAGTIHGDSPYGVFDRVVNDIGVPKTSFKATDLIIIASPIKSADGLKKTRRVTQITEVRKTWTDDPLLENGFSDLMKYNSKTDMLEPTSDLINGESDSLKAIAANVKEYAGDWDALWKSIELRAKCKETQLNYALKLADDDMLEAPFTIKCNDAMHLITDKIKNETGYPESSRVYDEWEIWLKREIKRRSLEKKR